MRASLAPGEGWIVVGQGGRADGPSDFVETFGFSFASVRRGPAGASNTVAPTGGCYFDGETFDTIGFGIAGCKSGGGCYVYLFVVSPFWGSGSDSSFCGRRTNNIRRPSRRFSYVFTFTPPGGYDKWCSAGRFARLVGGKLFLLPPFQGI